MRVRVAAFFRNNDALQRAVKVAVVERKIVRVLAVRCKATEGLAGLLPDKVKVGVLAHPHDAVLVIVNTISFGGMLPALTR